MTEQNNKETKYVKYVKYVKYNLGDKLYFMKDNKVQCGFVTKVQECGTMSFTDVFGDMKEKVDYRKTELTLQNENMIISLSLNIDAVFTSKQDLLDSL